MASPNFKFKNVSFNLFLSSLQKILTNIMDVLGLDPKDYEICEILNEEYVPEPKINAKTLENKSLSDIYSFTNRYDYAANSGGISTLSYPESWGLYNSNIDFMVQVFHDGKLLTPNIDYNLNVQTIGFTTPKTAHITIIRFHK